MEEAGASYEEKLLPGTRDLSEYFSTPREFLGDDFNSPCNEDQQAALRRNRSVFTSGEDNLVLRGVNLYGEKQWRLIADRYLPARAGNTIAQRYSKLCLLLYLANGIRVDHTGNLQKPPKLESVDDIDNDKVAEIKRADPPSILNVHRWSLEEDLTLLRAVPLMGHMWAELGARLVPHRDRGHLRKRYQVLQRRVKTAVSRSSKQKKKVFEQAMKLQDAPQQEHPQNSCFVRQTRHSQHLVEQTVKKQSEPQSCSALVITSPRTSSTRAQAEDSLLSGHVTEGVNRAQTANASSRLALIARKSFHEGNTGNSGAHSPQWAAQESVGWSRVPGIGEKTNRKESSISKETLNLPGSPDTKVLFAAADASRLHGVNFGALESRLGRYSPKPGNSG